MVERIRFHLDENVDPDVAAGLRRHGIDVTTTFEVGLQGKSDGIQWNFVRTQRRVLMTHDADFMRFARKDPTHMGIVYSAKGARSVGQVIRSLILIFEVLSADEMHGRVEYV